MTRARVALAAALLVLFAACGEPVVGTVVGKSYDDADTWTTYRQSCTGSGSTRSCHQVPDQRFDPEHYELRVRLDSDPDKTKTVRVDPGTYTATKVGAHYAEDPQ